MHLVYRRIVDQHVNAAEFRDDRIPEPGRSRRIRQIRREQRMAGSRQCREGLTGCAGIGLNAVSLWGSDLIRPSVKANWLARYPVNCGAGIWKPW